MIKEIRGWGLINGVEMTTESGVTAAEVAKLLMDTGILVVPAGPSVVRFVPPLIITEDEVSMAMEKFEAAVSAIAKR